MALWGNKDSKSATGTIAIANTGVVTGTSTLFTTESKVGNSIIAGGVDYQIVSITSNTVAKVVMGTNNGNGLVTTVAGGTSYTLSEKPANVAHGSADTFAMGRSGLVFGVDATEAVSGGDNVSAVSVASGGARYLEVPAVTFSGGAGSSVAATASIAAGAVSAIAVTNTGTAYTSAPTVAIAKPRRTIPTTGITTGTDTIAYTAHGLNAADVLVYNNGGGTSATGLVSGTTYYVIASGLTADAFKVSATDGGTTVDITGTGNNAQFFEIFAVVNRATGTAALGDGAVGGSQHAGWVRRTVGTGGRAGRVQYETLVAMGSITGDQSDDVAFRDS
jgi:hypothetical protein